MLLQRVLTALVLIALALALLLWAPAWLFFLGLLPFGLLALAEYLGLAARGVGAPPRWVVFLAALGIWVVAAYFRGHLLPAVLGGGLLVFLSTLWQDAPVEEILPASAAGVFALFYVGLPLALLLDLRGGEHGRRIILWLLLVVWAGDTAAYLVGRAVGRLKLTPRLSPGKTVEGTTASLVAAVGVGFWLLPAWFGVDRAHAFLLPVILNIATQFGDLAESGLKRSAGVKDSSGLLPGHGGMLDRLDSLLFGLPVVWYYWTYLIRGGF